MAHSREATSEADVAPGCVDVLEPGVAPVLLGASDAGGDANEASEKSKLNHVPPSYAPHQAEEQSVPEYRTRWLWFAKFTWGACVGRFMSLYYLDEGLDEEQIGVIFAVGSFTGPFISASVGLVADRLALQWRDARLWCFVSCLILGTAFFSLQVLAIPAVSRFVLMLLCRVFMSGFNTSADVLLTAITLQGLRDRKRFGEERLYGAVSWAIAHFFLGILIDRFGRMVQHIANVLALALTVLVVMCSGSLPTPQGCTEKKGGGLAALADTEALCALLRKLCGSTLMLAFFAYAVALASGMTIVENLVFLLFQELGASYFICGISVVVTVVFEIPLFYLSSWLLASVGAPGLVIAAGLCYSFRVLGYSVCPAGWAVLFFEPMHGITIAAHNTASVEIIAALTPPALTGTGQALYGLVRTTIGSAAGTWVGGVVIRKLGERECYRLSALVVFVGLLTYTAARRYSKQRPAEDEENQPVVVVAEAGDGEISRSEEA